MSRYVEITCVLCGAKAMSRRSTVESGKGGKYCSIACARKGRWPDLETRFWSKVIKTTTCWLWTAGQYIEDAKTESSITFAYGAFWTGTNNEHAHRVSWRLVNGPIPEGLNVLHSCDVTLCVRPDHLFLGTQDDNMKDMVAKGRSRAGIYHPHATLEDTDIELIRELYDMELPIAKIAELVHCSKDQAWRVATGRTYSTV